MKPEVLLSTLFWRGLLLAALWWVLTGDTAWWFGVPMIAASVGVSLALQPARHMRLRPWALARFVAFFLFQSMRAGLDVARRALAPRCPLAPALVDFRLRLPVGAARTLLVNTMTLLPGTLSADLDGRWLRLHVLDARRPVERVLRALEARIAATFGLTLKTSRSTPRRKGAEKFEL